MKKIRIFCAAMTIAVIGTFGGVALAADNTLKDVDNNTQQKLPAFTDGTVAAVEQQEVQVAMLSGFAEITEIAVRIRCCFPTRMARLCVWRISRPATGFTFTIARR